MNFYESGTNSICVSTTFLTDFHQIRTNLTTTKILTDCTSLNKIVEFDFTVGFPKVEILVLTMVQINAFNISKQLLQKTIKIVPFETKR